MRAKTPFDPPASSLDRPASAIVRLSSILGLAMLLAGAAAEDRPALARPVDPAVALLAPPQAPASAPAPAPAAPDLLLDLGALDRSERMALIEAAPELEEPVLNGTRRVSVSPARLAELRRLGLPVGLLGQAPASMQAWPSCYLEVAEALDWLRTYAEEHPHLVEVIDAGDSYCKAEGPCRSPKGDTLRGHDILVAKVTAREAGSAKSGRFWADGGLHARELPTIELMRALIQSLVEGYGRDPQISYLLDHRELYVGLAMNPDGREMVELGAASPEGRPWEWRKNAHRERESCQWPPTTGSHYGVDLNRNHSFKWQLPGHSTEPCEQTYRGRAPASEPETQAYAGILRQIFPDQRGPRDEDAAPDDSMGAMINFHNYTSPGTMLYPWSWTEARAPNYEGLVAIAEQYSRPLGYVIKNSLYPVSGDARDWAYGELGIPGYVIELQGDTFLTPCSQVPGLIRAHLPQLHRMLNLSDRPYQRPFGPTVSQIQLDTQELQQGEALYLSASLDGTAAAGGTTVAAAELTLGGPGGPPPGLTLPRSDALPGQGLPLSPDDGAFDALAESASLVLDTGQMPPGRYYLLVRAQGANGLWGDARAVWFTLSPAPPTPSPEPSSTNSPSPEPSPTSVPTAPPPAPATRRLWLPKGWSR